LLVGEELRTLFVHDRRWAITTVFFGILVVTLSALVAFAGLSLVHRLVPPPQREPHNTVGGIIFIPLSGLFGVLTAFMIGLSWQGYSETEDTTQREASSLAAIYLHAAELPDPESEQVQALARLYGQVVVDEEWPLMSQGKESERAWSITDELHKSINDFEPSTPAEQALRVQLAERHENMLDDRRLRLLDSRGGLPHILWVIMLGSGLIVVSFTYLFGMRNFWVHALMVATVTVVVATSLYTIKSFERPFTGDTMITPRTFELVLQGFERNQK
jgi:hypothetical protein